jgi:hypothetical protein
MNFERLRGTVISRVLGVEHAGDEAELFHYVLDEDKALHQGVARIVPDDDLRIIFTIPAETTSIFITVTDGDVSLVRRALANLEEMERDGTAFGVGEVVRFEGNDLEQHGIAAIVLMPLSVSGILSGLEETFEHDEHRYCFYLVMFLSFAEFGIWKAHGQEKLMSHLDDVDKDILTLRQESRLH